MTKYTTILAGMIEVTYEWFYEDLVKQDLLKFFQVNPDDFDGMIEFLSFSCVQLRLKDSLT